jgi:hypothetical protein
MAVPAVPVFFPPPVVVVVEPPAPDDPPGPAAPVSSPPHATASQPTAPTNKTLNPPLSALFIGGPSFAESQRHLFNNDSSGMLLDATLETAGVCIAGMSRAWLSFSPILTG